MPWLPIEQQAAADWAAEEIRRGRSVADCATLLAKSKPVTVAELESWLRARKPEKHVISQTGAVHGNERLLDAQQLELQWLEEAVESSTEKAEVVARTLDYAVPEIAAIAWKRTMRRRILPRYGRVFEYPSVFRGGRKATRTHVRITDRDGITVEFFPFSRISHRDGKRLVIETYVPSKTLNRRPIVSRIVSVAHLIRRDKHPIEQKELAGLIGVSKQATSGLQRRTKDFINKQTGGRTSFAGLDESRKAKHKRERNIL